jgi:hypothetical protein
MILWLRQEQIWVLGHGPGHSPIIFFCLHLVVFSTNNWPTSPITLLTFWRASGYMSSSAASIHGTHVLSVARFLRCSILNHSTPHGCRRHRAAQPRRVSALHSRICTPPPRIHVRASESSVRCSPQPRAGVGQVHVRLHRFVLLLVHACRRICSSLST